MKLCKLKMEADKTEAELQVKQMEKSLHALQNGHSSQVTHNAPPPRCCVKSHAWPCLLGLPSTLGPVVYTG